MELTEEGKNISRKSLIQDQNTEGMIKWKKKYDHISVALLKNCHRVLSITNIMWIQVNHIDIQRNINVTCTASTYLSSKFAFPFLKTK